MITVRSRRKRLALVRATDTAQISYEAVDVPVFCRVRWCASILGLMSRSSYSCPRPPTPPLLLLCSAADQAALQTARGEIRAARAEGISAQEAAEAMKAEASRRNAEIEQLRYVRLTGMTMCRRSGVHPVGWGVVIKVAVARPPAEKTAPISLSAALSRNRETHEVDWSRAERVECVQPTAFALQAISLAQLSSDRNVTETPNLRHLLKIGCVGGIGVGFGCRKPPIFS